MAVAKAPVKLQIVNAVAIDGKVHSIGSEITVDAKLAAELLRRGRAELATAKPTAKMTAAEKKAAAEAAAED
jgi:hypothetical protein